MGLCVLSLFDGIGCGRVALERAGISVDKYYASEIEPACIKIAQNHYPQIIELGDICNISYKDGKLTTTDCVYDVGHIDLIIGGSPCTDFSSIGYSQGMRSSKTNLYSLYQYLSLKRQGAVFEGQSYLFWEYVRLLKEIRPTYYLLENVVMPRQWKGIISFALQQKPILIDSALLSAQNRKRLYWTNISNVTVPQDKGVIIEDILDDTADSSDVSYTKTVQVALPLLVKKYGYIPQKFNAFNRAEIKDKACTLSRGSMVTSSCATLLFVKTDNGVHLVKDGILDNLYPTRLSDGKYNLRKLNLREMERLQTLADDYTNVDDISDSKRSQAIGNGWTVDVIAHILSFLK